MDTTRQTLADALSTMTGITGHPKRPKAVKAGDAWPLVAEVTRGPGLAWQTTWRIAVVIGADEGTAIDKLDAVLPEIEDALHELVYCDAARPLAIPTEGGDMYGLEIIARSE